jgi:cyanophycinase
VTGTFALLGSGEFEPWSREVDAWVRGRARGDGPVLLLPTASAPEGPEVFASWAAKGRAHFEDAGIPVQVLDVRTREDAGRPDVVEQVLGASVLYVSGGNPSFLAATFAATAGWAAVTGAIDRGLAYVGCSAGVACLTEVTYDSAAEDLTDVETAYKPGLGYVRGAMFGPHWDALEGWFPGATEAILSTVPAERTFIGIDEETAMVGDGTSWQVLGRGGIHVRSGEVWAHHASGDAFALPLRFEPSTAI